MFRLSTDQKHDPRLIPILGPLGHRAVGRFFALDHGQNNVGRSSIKVCPSLVWKEIEGGGKVGWEVNT